MGVLLLLLFIGTPILEIAVFIQAGELIGLWPTLAGVVATAALGSLLLRAQGLATLARLRSELDRGGLPAKELFDGACILIAGALLLTPGFVTDSLGFLLFVPPVRDWLRRRAAVYAARKQREAAATRAGRPGPGPGPGPGGGPGPGPAGGSRWGRGPDRAGGPVIEGEFEEVEPEDEGGEAPPRPMPDRRAGGERP